MSEPVVTGKSRLSYPVLFKPEPGPGGGDPKYSVTVLIPKSDMDTKARLDAAIAQAYHEGTNSQTWNGNPPPQPGITLYDGDGYTPKGEAWSDECKGHWVLRASSQLPPQVFDAACKPITNQSEIYAGCYANVLVHFYAYNTAGNRGIGCGLDGVQKIADGEPLGTRIDAAKYFTPQVTPAFQQPQHPAAQPAQPPYAPAPAYQPQQYNPAPTPAPAYAPQPAAPVYPPQYPPQAPPAAYPPQQATPQPQIDPITGKPVVGPIVGM